MKLILAQPRGFCAGVDRAIQVLQLVIERFDPPIYVKHEIVHNQAVIDYFLQRGVHFIETPEELGDDAKIVVISAHGVSRSVVDAFEACGVQVIDATCPLVTKVHLQAKRIGNQGADCFYIAHKGHPEVEGTLGYFDASYGGSMYIIETESDAQSVQIKQPDHVFCINQTTLSVTETQSIFQVLKQRFPSLQTFNKQDICYATQNRQDALRSVVEKVDAVIVVGSQFSSNSRRLYELAKESGRVSYLIDTPDDLDESILEHSTIGITSGASTPESSVQSVVDWFKAKDAACTIGSLTEIEEHLTFNLPKELRDANESRV